MTEPNGTLGTEGAGAGSEGSPAAGTGSVASGAEGTVSKERFDGLMASMNREKARAEAAEKRAAELEQQQAAARAAEANDEVKSYVDSQLKSVAAETSTVYNTLKAGMVRQLLERYPYAKPEDAVGTTPEEWEAGLKAEHERVAAVAEKEREAARKAAEEEFAKRYGVPLSVDGEGGPPPAGFGEVTDEQIAQAKERGNAQEVAKLLLMKPVPKQ